MPVLYIDGTFSYLFFFYLNVFHRASIQRDAGVVHRRNPFVRIGSHCQVRGIRIRNERIQQSAGNLI